MARICRLHGIHGQRPDGVDTHLVIDVIDRVSKLHTKAAHLKEEMKNAIIDNLRYSHEHGTDRPEVADWTWPY